MKRLILGFCFLFQIIINANSSDIISEIEGESTLRMAKKKAGPIVTDQGNLILDVLFKDGIKNPIDLEIIINNIPGVLENGLFVNLTDKVLVGKIENNIPILFSPSKVV